MNKKKKLLIAIGIIAVAGGGYYTMQGDTQEDHTIFANVSKEDLVMSVTTTGELEAKNSIQIKGPGRDMQKAGVWSSPITKLIPEGTRVHKGDFIAQLDASDLGDKITNSGEDLLKNENALIQAKLDTALTLREARDNILNLEYTVEENKIKLAQSTYEPPATIKQAEMDVEKAKRDFQQAKDSYTVKIKQAEAKIQDASVNYERVKRRDDFFHALVPKMSIFAPEDGMVIYQKNRNGTKVKENDNVSAWNPIVATLPDMSLMLSKTYVNEVDIRSIHRGQNVEIGLDAFPDKNYQGKVISVANVGEQRPNSNAKVFEVEIELAQNDTILRPSMTTSNRIITGNQEKVLCVPLEALNAQGDSITFVYKKAGLGVSKQEVKVGIMNDQVAQIVLGLHANDQVALTPVKSAEDEEVNRINIQ